MATVGDFIGSSVGEAAAFAAGLAIGPLLEPYLQELKNETWSHTPTRPLDPASMAQGVAEHKINPADGQNEAALSGLGATPFASLVKVMQKAPGIADGIRLIRRGQLTPGDFVTVLQRNGLEDAFVTAYQQVGVNDLQPVNEPLDPAVIANAIVRGIMDAPFPLPYTPPTGTGHIQAFPTSTLHTESEAAASGVDLDRLFVETAIVGRPMGAVEAAEANFRGILTDDDYLRAILEGDTRGEWAQAIKDRARQILTAHDWVELHLRGYIDQSQMYAGTALHGMSPDDTDRLFEVLGRPLTVHQITTGLARGGVFNPTGTELTDPYEASVHESNIKPSYYDLAIANRYNYPALFQLNALVKANAITADEAKDWANKDGYAPEVVDALYKFWQGEQASSTTATGVRTKTFTYSQIHQAWRNSVFGTGATNDQIALSELEDIGYPPAKAQILLNTWKATPPPSSATA